MSTSPENPSLGFRNVVNSVREQKTWVSPFRQNAPQPAKGKPQATATTPATQSEETKPASSDFKPPYKNPLPPKTTTSKSESDVKEKTDESKPKKKVIVEPIIDLGGGLKMPESKILAIAKERLSKDLKEIDAKAGKQQDLKEIKRQKKRELQDLRDQHKSNSKFALFKRKLDFSDKKFTAQHDRAIGELEKSISSIDKQIADFDTTTQSEIQSTVKIHAERNLAADEKLGQDKKATVLDAEVKEKEHRSTIHDHVISQKRSEIQSRVLQAKRSEYELQLELLELQLTQNSREVVKQTGVNTEHNTVKEDLELKVKNLKDAIAENDAAILTAKDKNEASENEVKGSEEELAGSQKQLESLKTELASIKAGALGRATRLHEAKKKRQLYEEEEEGRKKKAEEEAKIAAEKKAKEEEEARIAKEKKDEEARIAKEKEEEERLAKEAADKKAKEQEEARAAEAAAAAAAAKAEEDRVAKEAAEKNASEPAIIKEAKASAVPVVVAASAATASGSNATKSAPSSASPSEVTKTNTPASEEKKSKRTSGFFSVFKRKNSDEKAKEKSSKSNGKSKTLIGAGVGAAVAGAAGVAVAATSATTGGAGAAKEVAKSAITPAAPDSKSAYVSNASADVPTTPNVDVVTTEKFQDVDRVSSDDLTVHTIEGPASDKLDAPLSEKAVDIPVTPIEPLSKSIEAPVEGKPIEDTINKENIVPESEVPTIVALPTPPTTASATTAAVSVPAGSLDKESLPVDSPVVTPQLSSEKSGPLTDELSSREGSAEPTPVLGKTAKKNAKKRAAKKRKKQQSAIAAEFTPETSPQPASEPSTAAKYVAPAAAVTSVGAAAVADETITDPKPHYSEPSPIVIPQSQKFTVAEGVSTNSHADELKKEPVVDRAAISSGNETDSGLLETAGVATAPVVAATGDEEQRFPTLDPKVTGASQAAQKDVSDVSNGNEISAPLAKTSVLSSDDTDSLYSYREVIVEEEVEI